MIYENNRVAIDFAGKDHPLQKVKPIEYAKSMGCDFSFMKEVHGNSIVHVRNENSYIEKTDGLLTKNKKWMLMGTFADCVPVFFVDEKLGYIAIAHAGWKGIYYSVVEKMMEQLLGCGCSLKNIHVIIGPCICSNHYEVKEDFRRNFRNSQAFFQSNNLLYFDLVEEIVQRIPVEVKITKMNTCTFENQQYYSFRREPSERGRNIGCIWLK